MSRHTSTCSENTSHGPLKCGRWDRPFISFPASCHFLSTGIPPPTLVLCGLHWPRVCSALVPARRGPGPGWRAGRLRAASLAVGWEGCSWWGECFSSRPPGNRPYAHMHPPAGSHQGWCQTSPGKGKGAVRVKTNEWKRHDEVNNKMMLWRDNRITDSDTEECVTIKGFGSWTIYLC